uniref:NFX1-type zinc finger-containing protein 1-like n=1 Tax=Crassostrea virginica TaxID=6565 RepID=A0A8B8AVR1_CRAVI|nr:NFX1-type zinc finger-containing protein 1-like [Crassostrea virginica]
MDSENMFFFVAILVKAYQSNKEQNCTELTKILSSKQVVLNNLVPFVDKNLYGIISYPEAKQIAELSRNLCQLTLILFRNMQGSLQILKMFLEKLEQLMLNNYRSVCEELCPEIFSELGDLKEARDTIERDYINKLKHREEPKRRQQQHENQDPPDDFHDLSVLPTIQDLQFNKKPILRVNKTKGGYDNLQQYLDIQFRLLREDYLHPLREGILDYRRELEDASLSGKKQQTDIRIYENVEVIRPVCSNQGVRHVIRFDNAKLTKIRWESSRRLLYGSLLCLSPDGFQTMLFATVTERQIEDLANGYVEVQFTEEAKTFILSSTQTYIMAETTAYFEAYRHILKGLQEVGNEMPLQSSIVHCKPNEKPPRYLIKGGSVMQYDFSPLLKSSREAQVVVLNTKRWPSSVEIGMDDSQHKALQMAITKEIAIIQGPPGTGKTYVGLKIVHLLLHNKQMWTENVKMDPILVVCYTNHALDQFLVGLLKYSEKLVRIGGRCKTKELEEYTLQNYRMKAREEKSISRTIHEKKADSISNMQNCREKIDRVSEKLKCAKQGILRLQELEQCMDKRHKESFSDIPRGNKGEANEPKRSIDEWLGLNNFSNVTEDEGDDNKRMLMMEWEEELTKGIKIDKMETDTAQDIKDPWRLSLKDRGSLYKHFLREYQDSISNEILFHKNRLSLKQSTEPLFIQKKINTLLKYRAKSEKIVLQSTRLASKLPNYAQIILRMIRNKGDTLEWLCLNGSPQSCSQIAGVLHMEYKDIKEDEEDERQLDGETVGDNDEWNFFTGYKVETLKKGLTSENLSEASLAILKRDEESENEHGWVYQINRSKLQHRLKEVLDSNDIMEDHEVANIKNIWELNNSDRQRLYRYWVKRYITHMKESIQETEKQYDDLCRGYREVLDAEEVEIMGGADVLGMTTTGAAKYRNILQSIKPKIIIVEEAAEVLESHIVTTINSNCQHLILIGDHKQLRPTPTVYFLAKKYNLDISLFERMVNNDLNYVTLGIQHRMRPEISVLMRNENLYPELRDHENVKAYEHIKGVISDVFFIAHNEPESDDRETKSKSNIHEANFVKRLCKYFLQQDYERGQITILTAYTGQILALKKEMPRNDFEGVRITSIDNFQGEENDI